MHTIVLIQIIKYSYITVSRKYTYWQNNTQVFLTNPCSLKKMFTLRVTHQLILRKHGFAKKNCVLFCQFKYTNFLYFEILQSLCSPSWDKECVRGRFNANLRSKIRNKISRTKPGFRINFDLCFWKDDFIKVTKSI